MPLLSFNYPNVISLVNPFFSEFFTYFKIIIFLLPISGKSTFSLSVLLRLKIN